MAGVNDDIRGLMRELAEDAPLPPGLMGDVRNRAGAIRRRRSVTTATALIAAGSLACIGALLVKGQSSGNVVIVDPAGAPRSSSQDSTGPDEERAQLGLITLGAGFTLDLSRRFW